MQPGYPQANSSVLLRIFSVTTQLHIRALGIVPLIYGIEAPFGYRSTTIVLLLHASATTGEVWCRVRRERARCALEEGSRAPGLTPGTGGRDLKEKIHVFFPATHVAYEDMKTPCTQRESLILRYVGPRLVILLRREPQHYLIQSSSLL